MLPRLQPQGLLRDLAVQAHEEGVGPPAALGQARHADGVAERGLPVSGLPDQGSGRHLVARNVVVLVHGLHQAVPAERLQEVLDHDIGFLQGELARVGRKRGRPPEELPESAPGAQAHRALFLAGPARPREHYPAALHGLVLVDAPRRSKTLVALAFDSLLGHGIQGVDPDGKLLAHEREENAAQPLAHRGRRAHQGFVLILPDLRVRAQLGQGEVVHREEPALLQVGGGDAPPALLVAVDAVREGAPERGIRGDWRPRP